MAVKKKKKIEEKQPAVTLGADSLSVRVAAGLYPESISVLFALKQPS